MKHMKYIKYITFVILITLHTSCSDKEKFFLSSSKELLEFRLDKTNNSDLEEDIIAIIEDNKIKLTIKDNVDREKLIATFNHSGDKVLVNNIEQESGSTYNNFDEKIEYIIVAADQTTNTYTVEIEEISTSKEMLTFSFKKEYNPELKEDIVAKIENDIIKLSILQTINIESLIATFEHTGTRIIIKDQEQESNFSSNNFNDNIVYTIVAQDESIRTYSIEIDWIKVIKVNLPHIYVDIDNNEPMETVDKKRELNAVIRIDGKGEYDNYEGETTIRGRGNTTWSMPKKPYRLKLKEAASLMGLPPYKNWVLLNEYLDGSMLYNSIPFKAAQLLDIPYTNTIIPVELTINGEYRGVYAFTEHKEVGEGRIDIGEDGWLLEMDVYYDEDWKFKSENFQLPMMIQYPKGKNMNNEQLLVIEKDFNQLETLIYDESFPNNKYLEYFDDMSFINYIIVYELTRNPEINHPKSTYINKLKDGKYRMGIIWDFDWGYGYTGSSGGYYVLEHINKPLFSSDERSGARFFNKLISDPHMQSLFKERWNWFKNNKMDELKEYVTEYAHIVGKGLEKDHAVWGDRGASSDAEVNINKIMDWIEGRANYLDTLYGF